MGENLVFGLIGFVVGGIVGGYLMGRNCARQYRRTIEQLENERDQLIEERRRGASRASQGRLRALEEAEKQLNKNIGIVDDKTAEKLRKYYNGEEVDNVPERREGTGEEEDDVDPVAEKVDEDYDLEHDDFDFDDPFGDDDADPDNVVDICKSGFVGDADGDDDSRKIRMLSKKEFDDDFLVRGSYTMTYYQEDGILTDSDQEVVHDQAEVLGEEVMGMIDETPKDVIYIDNEVDEALYEVIVEHSLSYYRDVLGV